MRLAHQPAARGVEESVAADASGIRSQENKTCG